MTVMPASTSAKTPALGTGAKLIERINEPMRTTDKMPPRLSTEPVVSLMCAGTSRIAITIATAASGNVMRKTEPHQKCCSSAPAHNGPSAAIAPPVPDHKAIDFVRLLPDHSAVIKASVVG